MNYNASCHLITCLVAKLSLQSLFGGGPDLPHVADAHLFQFMAHVPAHSWQLIYLQVQQVCIHLQVKYLHLFWAASAWEAPVMHRNKSTCEQQPPNATSRVTVTCR